MADAWLPIATAAELPPGATKKFTLHCAGGEIDAFVLNHGGSLRGWVNRCCHIPMTMDWVENQFLTDDGQHIQCATHGALYEPATGRCVAGPPLGKCLTPVPIEVRDGTILARCPSAAD